MTGSQQLPDWMTQPLEVIFGELGISQYLDAFLDQGFDTWETILDITESDLDALGVKLGHRRKLQRRIANFRGLAPEASLVSPTQPSIEDTRHDAVRPEGLKAEHREIATIAIAKRKYRRHPKPDENAPPRPPSAYVLFSNKMRDELKGRNLTFTEIAKLVGEHWQNLSQAEKKSLESQAQTAKDKYNSDLAEYKKTANYKKYSLYLQEFKAKHAHQSQDKDGSKRLKVSEARGGSPNGTIRNGTSSRSSRARSASGASEGELGSEHSAARRLRIGSAVSTRESQSVTTPTSYYTSLDESFPSPSSHAADRRSLERSPVVTTSPPDLASIAHLRSSWSEDPRHEQAGMQHHLPPLSNMFDQQPNGRTSTSHSDEINGYGFPQAHTLGSPGAPPPLVGGESRPHPLRKGPSWASSSSSGSSFGHPRTPIDGPLAIHTLLSADSDQKQENLPLFYGNSTIPEHTPPSFPEQRGSSNRMLYANEFKPGPGPVMQPHSGQRSAAAFHPTDYNTKSGEKPEPNLDGMSALLRAGEIVGQRVVDQRPRREALPDAYPHLR